MVLVALADQTKYRTIGVDCNNDGRTYSTATLIDTLMPGELLRKFPAGAAAASDPFVDVGALGVHSLDYRRKGVRQPLVRFSPQGP